MYFNSNVFTNVFANVFAFAVGIAKIKDVVNI